MLKKFAQGRRFYYFELDFTSYIFCLNLVAILWHQEKGLSALNFESVHAESTEWWKQVMIDQFSELENKGKEKKIVSFY